MASSMPKYSRWSKLALARVAELFISILSLVRIRDELARVPMR